MKRKFISLIVVFVICVCFSGVAFAAQYSYSVYHSAPLHSRSVAPGESVSVTATVDFPSNAGGNMYSIPIKSISDTLSVWKWVNVPDTVSCNINSCVGTNGLPIPYWFQANGSLTVVIPSDYLGDVTISATFYNGGSDIGTLSGNSSCAVTYLGVYQNMTLSDYLAAFQSADESITYSLSSIQSYCEFLRSIDADTGQIATTLSTLLKTVDGLDSGQTYTNNYLLQIIDLIEDIPISDYTSTLNQMFTTLNNNLKTIGSLYDLAADYTSAYNKFAPDGQMHFMPNLIVSKVGDVSYSLPYSEFDGEYFDIGDSVHTQSVKDIVFRVRRSSTDNSSDVSLDAGLYRLEVSIQGYFISDPVKVKVGLTPSNVSAVTLTPEAYRATNYYNLSYTYDFETEGIEDFRVWLQFVDSNVNLTNSRFAIRITRLDSQLADVQGTLDAQQSTLLSILDAIGDIPVTSLATVESNLGSVLSQLQQILDVDKRLEATVSDYISGYNKFAPDGQMFFMPNYIVSKVDGVYHTLPYTEFAGEYCDIGDTPDTQSVRDLIFRARKSPTDNSSLVTLDAGTYRLEISFQSYFDKSAPAILVGLSPSAVSTVRLSPESYQGTNYFINTYTYTFTTNGIEDFRVWIQFPDNNVNVSLARFAIRFTCLDTQLASIDDTLSGIRSDMTALIADLRENGDTLSSLGLDVQALLDFLTSDEFFAGLEDKLGQLIQEQQLTNETLADIRDELAALREYLENNDGGGSGGSGGSSSDTEKQFNGVLDTILSGVISLIGDLLGMLLKVVFGLLGWTLKFLGFINSDYLGGFFPAPVWSIVCVIVPLVVVLGLIRFIRGFL